MVSRVSHCELRDLEWAAVVGPAEWLGLAVVVLDERDDAVGEFVAAGELAVSEHPSLLADTFDGDGGVTFDGDEIRSV